MFSTPAPPAFSSFSLRCPFSYPRRVTKSAPPLPVSPTTCVCPLGAPPPRNPQNHLPLEFFAPIFVNLSPMFFPLFNPSSFDHIKPANLRTHLDQPPQEIFVFFRYCYPFFPFPNLDFCDVMFLPRCIPPNVFFAPAPISPLFLDPAFPLPNGVCPLGLFPVFCFL